jgi:hypothetical protein
MKDKPDAPRRFHMHETSRTLALEGLPLALSVGIHGEGCGFERAVASSEQKPLLLRDTFGRPHTQFGFTLLFSRSSSLARVRIFAASSVNCSFGFCFFFEGLR